MVGTVGAARQLGGRGALAVADGAFASGLGLGAAFLFGALGALGAALQPGRPFVVVVVALAAAAALADLAGLRVRPQVRFQVPERWRQTMPLSRAIFLYGLLLGTSVTTFVPAAAVWALLPLSVAVASVPAGIAVGLSFAAGRALPVLALAARGDETALAERPRGLRLLRVLAGGSLVAALAAGAAGAVTPVSSPAGDPSAAATDLAWQQPGVGGFLSRDGVRTQLPGTDPAVGGSLVVWRSGDAVTVAARDTLAPTLQETIPGAQKLAVSDELLAFRAAQSNGSERILVQSLSDPSRTSIAVHARPAGQLGRPSLFRDVVAYHVATAEASWIGSVNVRTGRRRTLRYSRRAQLLNPSRLGSKLLYVRASRCSQQLRIGPLGGGRERILYELPPVAKQDAGHERGHTRQGEHPPCPRAAKPTERILWTTALSATTAYVTVLQPRRGGRTTPTLLAIRR